MNPESSLQASPNDSEQAVQAPLALDSIQPLSPSTFSPWTHVAILTSVLAPVALVPYLAVRRHLLSLHRKVAEIGAANAALQRDLRSALVESSIRREEHDHLKASLDEFRRGIETLRTQEHERELARTRQELGTRASIQELLAEREKTRAGLSHLKDLSSSLADIAAFMQEVEVQQGFVSRKNDGRGIEKIRQLAYRLYNLDALNSKEATQKKGEAKGGKPDASNA